MNVLKSVCGGKKNTTKFSSKKLTLFAFLEWKVNTKNLIFCQRENVKVYACYSFENSISISLVMNSIVCEILPSLVCLINFYFFPYVSIFFLRPRKYASIFLFQSALLPLYFRNIILRMNFFPHVM